MRIGELKDRVKLQRKVASRNTFGEEVVSWVDVATLWAAVKPLSGREIMSQGRAEALVTYRVMLRRRPDLTPEMRVLWGGRTLAIQSATHDERATTLLCSEVIGG